MVPSNNPLQISAEALLSITGIFPEEPPGTADAKAAILVPGRWRSAVKEFFDRDKPTRFHRVALPYKHTRMVEMLANPPDNPQWLTMNFHDPDLTTVYLTLISNAREYMRSKWPNLEIQTFTGPRSLEPGRTFVQEMAALYSVVNNPTVILDEMISGTLMPAQVEAVEVLYPSLFGMLNTFIEERKQIELTRSRSWSISWAKDRMIRRLYKMPMGVDMRETPRPPPKTAQPGQMPVINLALGDYFTHSQKIEAP